MSPHRYTSLLACVLLCVSCGRKRVNETVAPVPGKSWTVPELGLELVFVEEGSLQTQPEDEEGDKAPVREVHIARPFWMGTSEVTQAQYEWLMRRNPSAFRRGTVVDTEWKEGWWGFGRGSHEIKTTGDTAEFPVKTVSWDDAVESCG